MKIFSVKRTSIPKAAVLVAGVTGAILVATLSPQAAQAFPSYASTCTGCHTAGGSVKATPTSTSLVPGASYTVNIAITGGTTGSNSGYWISGNGVSVVGAPAAGATRTQTMTAPAASGTYTYTVWVRQGVASSTTYSITVAPPVTVPPTTIAPTIVPTKPPVTIAPTTPPTTIAPTIAPTKPPVTIAPTTPPTTIAPSPKPTKAPRIPHVRKTHTPRI